jgi:hypothetical protein
MIERSTTVFRIDRADVGDYFVDRFAGYEPGREFFEESKTGGKILEAFLS